MITRHGDVSPGYYVIMGAVAGEPGYPKWIRPYLILIISAVWAGLNVVAAATEGRVAVPWEAHLLMAAVVVSLFRVEFGNIKISRREDDPK